MSLKTVLKQRRSEIFKIADQYGVHNIRIFGPVGKETEIYAKTYLLEQKYSLAYIYEHHY